MYSGNNELDWLTDSLTNGLGRLTDLTVQTDLTAKTWKIFILDDFGTFWIQFWTEQQFSKNKTKFKGLMML